MFGRKKKKSDLDWQPEPEQVELEAPAISSVSQSISRQEKTDVWNGLVHPRSILGFFGKYFGSIVTITIVVFVLGIVGFILLPAKYTTKALILVDPRLPQITNTEAVVSGIGGDAAALTSYVEIMNSDGFLGDVVERLGVKDDPEFAKAENRTELISMFRKNLGASRQGATYIVQVSYKSKSKENAAKYANGVAEAFVSDQRNYRTTTSEDATQWLLERLTALQSNLKKSEDAVAAFQGRNGIVDGGAQGTLDNQQLASLVTQLGAATTEVAEAKARYQQATKDGIPSLNGASQNGEFVNLDQLLQEQDRLRRQAAELGQTLGSRHPRILANAEQQRIIAGQIDRERRRLVVRTKQAFQTAEAKKMSLERQLADARQRSIELNKSRVELATLQREADANRNLYEQFLARYKITDEQSQFQFSEARIVSSAPVPNKSTKPSLALMIPVLGMLGLGTGILISLIREAFSAPHPDDTGAYVSSETRISDHLERPAEHYLEPAIAEPSVALAEDPDVTQLQPNEDEELDDEQIALPQKRAARRTARAPLTPQDTAPEEDDLQEEPRGAETIVQLNQPGKSVRSPRLARAAAASMARRKMVAPADDAKSAVLIELPKRNARNRDTMLDDLIETHSETLERFTDSKLDGETVSVLVTAAQPGEGQEITADLVREFAIDCGFHPVVISMQDQSDQARQAHVSSSAQADQTARLQEFEHFDMIPFATAGSIGSGRGLSRGLAAQLANLVEMCKENYGFVILETHQILDPQTLEDLIDIVDAGLMVLEGGALSEADLVDWQDWAATSQVGLVLDQT